MQPFVNKTLENGVCSWFWFENPTILEISLRTTSISLDVLKSRHHWKINQISENKKHQGSTIKVVYLNFDDLPDNILKKVKDIGTNFNISAEQQEELFKAAEVLVKSHAHELMMGIFGENWIE